LDSNRLVANGQLVPYLDNLVCPSRVSSSRSEPLTSYIANGGYSGINQGGGDSPENGIFLNQIGRQVAGAGYRPVRPVRMAHLRDGSSATILMSENLPDDLYWHACSNLPIDPADASMDYSIPDHTGSDPSKPPFVSYDLTAVGGATAPRYMNTFYFHYTNETLTNSPQRPAVTLPFAEIYSIDGDKALGPFVGTSGAAVARPSSNHRGGVNVVFADNHTEFLVNSIEYTVYQQLMTPNGLRSSMPRNQYLLRDVDWKR
jgi:prepilin-type processing-associated H-X9-DG protein